VGDLYKLQTRYEINYNFFKKIKYIDTFKSTKKKTTCILANSMRNVHFFHASRLSTPHALPPVLREQAAESGTSL